MSRGAVVPVGWVEQPSRVSGVRVFAPPPEVDEAPANPTFRCPSCAHPTAFDVAQGRLACAACGWAEEAPAQPGGATAHAEFTLEALRLAPHGWGLVRRETHCESCGADLAVADGALAASCAFCGSNRLTLRERADDALRPQVILPFTVVEGALAEAVGGFLRKGWFHPNDLAQAARLDRFQGIYAPFWFFSATLDARWSAEVGHTRTYTTGSGKNRRTRTKTVWLPEHGHFVDSVGDLPLLATTHLDRARVDRLRPWPSEGFADFSPSPLAGFHAQAYDIGLVPSWETGRAELRELARLGCMTQPSTSKVRNFRMTCDMEHESWRYGLAPIWVATYQYKGESLQILVNGQTGLVVGQKPVAWWKVWVAIGAVLSPGALLLGFSLPLAFLGVGLAGLVVAVILLVLGGIGSFALYNHANHLEAQ